MKDLCNDCIFRLCCKHINDYEEGCSEFKPDVWFEEILRGNSDNH